MSYKGHYDKANYLLAKDLITYGNAYEYVFVDAGGRIQSKVIAPEDAFPVYDNNFNYTCFVEHWQDGIAGGIKHHIIYYTHSIEIYRDFELIETRTNLTGLPIHYAALNKSEYSQYGRGLAEPLIPVLDAIESLTAKMDDTVKTNILNPVAVVTGLLEDAEMPRDMVGAALRMEVGSEMTYSSPRLDYATMNLLLGTYIEQFFSIAGIPGVVMNQSNVSNLSETSLRMLFTQTETRAKETIIALKDGMMTRLAYIRTLLENQGKRYSDEAFDTLDLSFVTGMPVDSKEMMEVMQMQHKMGAISRQTIIERSPLTNDVAGEIKRIEEEAHNPSNAKDGVLGQQE
ncbi:MAG: phage portal protein [Christensenellaceae bacterium]|nr:phage portal protein [Christensenellaceae bacterium]